MDDLGSIVGYGAVVFVMALMIYAVVVFECLPRRRAADRDVRVMMADTVARSSPPEPLFDPIPADNDIRFHNCTNCGRQFLEMSAGPVWTSSEAMPGHRVWYCSTACADAMPFLPDPDAQAYARHIRTAMEREYPGRAPSVYAEAIRLRRTAEQQIREERRRVENDMRLMRERYGVNHPPRSRPGRVRRPAHFTGQEPEDL